MLCRNQAEVNAASSENSIAIRYQGVDVRRFDDRLVSLDDMWLACGSPPNREPRQWKRLTSTARFVEAVARSEKVEKSHLIRTARGRGNKGMAAHWKLAVAYGEYLSPEFHDAVVTAFRRWTEEEGDPGLKAYRAALAYKRQGRDDAWIGARFDGIDARHRLTSVMSRHGCQTGRALQPYAEATRTLNLAVTGKTPSEFRAEKGFVGRTRDHMSARELLALAFAESESAALIAEQEAFGNAQCLAAVRTVGQALESFRKATASA